MVHALSNGDLRILTDTVFTIRKCLEDVVKDENGMIFYYYETLLTAYCKLNTLLDQKEDFFEDEDLLNYLKSNGIYVSHKFFIGCLFGPFGMLEKGEDKLYKMQQEYINHSKSEHYEIIKRKMILDIFEFSGKYSDKVAPYVLNDYSDEYKQYYLPVKIFLEMKYEEFKKYFIKTTPYIAFHL